MYGDFGGAALGTAVLFLVFNRPATTRQVFETIRRARPSRLYVAADGPRDNHPDERERCEMVREIATAVDWSCEVRTLFRDKNLGCGAAVSSAIDWFFAHEPEGIILEDDCLPDQSFFRFCEELLERYRDNTLVMAISGGYYHGKHCEPPPSYFFSRHADIWGWASWRRAWRYYDQHILQWPNLRNSDWLMRLADGHRDFRDYWTEIFDAVHADRTDTWGYQWVFACWSHNGLTVMPSKHLVKNIGFGGYATHTQTNDGLMWRQALETISFPLKHPEALKRDHIADRWMDLNVYGTRSHMYRRILRGIPGLRRAVHRLRQFVS